MPQEPTRSNRLYEYALQRVREIGAKADWVRSRANGQKWALDFADKLERIAAHSAEVAEAFSHKDRK